MDLGLTGRRFVLGGASRGIGRATATALLAEGADVAILAREPEGLGRVGVELRSARPERRVVDIAVDLRDAQAATRAVERAARELGGLDGAIACAGSGVGVAGAGVASDEWERLLGVNLMTAVNLCSAVGERIVDGGAIALVASIAGQRRLDAPLPYKAAKAALIRYARDLATALAPRRIRVNVVSPGNVRFPGGRWEELLAADREGVERYIASEVPLKRFGAPEEIADALVFLCSARSGFTTGACLTVDGGQLGG